MRSAMICATVFLEHFIHMWSWFQTDMFHRLRMNIKLGRHPWKNVASRPWSKNNKWKRKCCQDEAENAFSWMDHIPNEFEKIHGIAIH